MQHLTDILLDNVIPLGRMDLVRNLAFPLPVLVVCDLLGIPEEVKGPFVTGSAIIPVMENNFFHPWYGTCRISIPRMDDFCLDAKAVLVWGSIGAPSTFSRTLILAVPRWPANPKNADHFENNDDGEESLMRPHTCMMSALTLSTGMAFGAISVAAELPREGTFSATHSAFGTVKVTTIGKDRVMFVFDENGLTRSNGLLDRTTSHCWGMAEFVNGVGAPYGSCVATDPDGDQISIDFTHEKWHTPNEKNVHASATITAGTGKYSGITGGWTYVAHVNEFRTAVEGTYAVDTTTTGSYKLP